MASLPPFPLLAFILILAYQAPQRALAQSQKGKDQSQILNCVHSVFTHEGYGFIDVNGTTAFKLLESNKTTTVAGGRYGKGRVIGAGHYNLLANEPFSEKGSDRARFLENMFEWVSGDCLKTVALVNAYAYPNRKTLQYLQQWFNKVLGVNYDQLEKTKADVFVIDFDFHAHYTAILLKKIEEGAGAIVMTPNHEFAPNFGTPQGFKTYFGPNLVVEKAGFSFRHSKEFASGGASRGRNKFDSAIKYKCLIPKGRSAC